MKKKKVWVLMTALSKIELDQFGRWMEGELTPNQENVKLLFEELKLYHDKEAPMKEVIFQQISLTSKNAEVEWRKLLHQLTELLVTFFALLEFQNDEMGKQYYFLKRVLGKIDGNTWEKSFRKVLNVLNESPIKGKNYYRRYFELILLYKQYLLARTSDEGSEIQLKKALSIFDQWWVREKLALTTADISQRASGEMDQKGYMEDAFLEHLSFDTSEIKGEFYSLHLQFLNLSQDSSDSDITQLLNNFRQDMHHLILGEQKDLYTLILNYLIKQLQNIYAKESLGRVIKWYEWGIENRLLSQHGFLPISHFLNLLFLKLNQDDDEILSFIEKTSRKLDPDVKIEVRNYAEGRYFFHKKDFKTAANRLDQDQFPNPYHQALGRIVHWQSIYEKEPKGVKDWEKERRSYLLPRIKYMEKMIKEQSGLLDTQRRNFLNTVRRFVSLARVNSYLGLVKQHDYLEEIYSPQRRKWFKDKINERIQIEFPEKVKDLPRNND